MKRLLSLFLVFLLVILPSAYAEEEIPEPQNLVLYLEAVRAADFDWFAEVRDADIAETETVDFIPSPNEPDGAIGQTVIQISGLSAGVTEVTLRYHRTWGSHPEDILKFTLAVSVDEECNVSLQYFIIPEEAEVMFTAAESEHLQAVSPEPGMYEFLPLTDGSGDLTFFDARSTNAYTFSGTAEGDSARIEAVYFFLDMEEE